MGGVPSFPCCSGMLQTDLNQLGIIHTFAKAETGLGPSINLCWVDGGEGKKGEREGGI